MTIIRITTPQLYVSPRCCVMLDILTTGVCAMPLSCALLLRSNDAILYFRMIVFVGRGSKLWDSSVLWFGTFVRMGMVQ